MIRSQSATIYTSFIVESNLRQVVISLLMG